ncbi:hypothetical protein [Bradyrhizobium sp.]|uniref:hypothetical protein n=1 Tax=Bradyrhizobium sp. TaxID=376 RepID=UPI0039E72635
MKAPPKRRDRLGERIQGEDFNKLRRLVKNYGLQSVEAALQQIAATPGKRVGRPTERDPFVLTMLWARVRAEQIRSERVGKKIPVNRACALVAKRQGLFSGAQSSVERMYYQADKIIGADTEYRSEMEGIALEMSR